MHHTVAIVTLIVLGVPGWVGLVAFFWPIESSRDFKLFLSQRKSADKPPAEVIDLDDYRDRKTG